MMPIYRRERIALGPNLQPGDYNGGIKGHSRDK